MALALTILLVLGCVAASLSVLSRVSRAVPMPESTLINELRRAESLAVVSGAVAGLPEEHPARLMVAAAASDSAPACVASLNEQVSELHAALAAGDAIPRASVRVAWFGSGCLCLVELSRALSAGRPAIQTVLPILAVGGVGAVSAALLSHHVAQVVKRRRAAYDEVIGALERLIDRRFGKAEATQAPGRGRVQGRHGSNGP